MLIKNSAVTGRFVLRVFSSSRMSNHLRSKFIQIEAATNRRKKELKTCTTSGLIQLYVKYFVCQFYYFICINCFVFSLWNFLSKAYEHDGALSFSWCNSYESPKYYCSKAAVKVEAFDELNGRSNKRVATFFLESFSDIIGSKVIICEQRIVTSESDYIRCLIFIYDFQ